MIDGGIDRRVVERQCIVAVAGADPSVDCGFADGNDIVTAQSTDCRVIIVIRSAIYDDIVINYQLVGIIVQPDAAPYFRSGFNIEVFPGETAHLALLEVVTDDRQFIGTRTAGGGIYIFPIIDVNPTADGELGILPEVGYANNCGQRIRSDEAVNCQQFVGGNIKAKRCRGLEYELLPVIPCITIDDKPVGAVQDELADEVAEVAGAIGAQGDHIVG